MSEPELKMPFGRHKGTLVKELPGDYLRWLGTIELRSPLREVVTAVLSWKAVSAAPGVPGTTPTARNANAGHHTQQAARSMGSQRAFPGHDAARPKPRAWIPQQEDLSAYYTPQGADDIPW
jgi:hypothetical protein